MQRAPSNYLHSPDQSKPTLTPPRCRAKLGQDHPYRARPLPAYQKTSRRVLRYFAGVVCGPRGADERRGLHQVQKHVRQCTDQARDARLGRHLGTNEGRPPPILPNGLTAKGKELWTMPRDPSGVSSQRNPGLIGSRDRGYPYQPPPVENVGVYSNAPGKLPCWHLKGLALLVTAAACQEQLVFRL